MYHCSAKHAKDAKDAKKAKQLMWFVGWVSDSVTQRFVILARYLLGYAIANSTYELNFL
jgi:beta-lactamase class D